MEIHGGLFAASGPFIHSGLCLTYVHLRWYDTFYITYKLLRIRVINLYADSESTWIMRELGFLWMIWLFFWDIAREPTQIVFRVWEKLNKRVINELFSLVSLRLLGIS